MNSPSSTLRANSYESPTPRDEHRICEQPTFLNKTMESFRNYLDCSKNGKKQSFLKSLNELEQTIYFTQRTNFQKGLKKILFYLTNDFWQQTKKYWGFFLY